jgi:hypothetical protein
MPGTLENIFANYATLPPPLIILSPYFFCPLLLITGTFTTLAKIYSTKCFFNTKVAGLGEIFVQRNFYVYGTYVDYTFALCNESIHLTHTLSRLQMMRRKSPSPELVPPANERAPSATMLTIPEGREGPGPAPLTEEREPAAKTRGEGERVSVNGEVSSNSQGRGLKRHISK